MKRAILTVFACLALAACGAEESETTATSAAEPSEEPAAGGGGGGGSPCSRARDCCNAYVDAMGSPAITAEQACAGIAAAESAGGPGADTSCTTMISGWRTSLSAMGRDVPAACN
jgi:hypothetical protein